MKTIGTVFWIVVCIFAGSNAFSAQAMKSDSIYQLRSQWTTERGDKISIEAFRGKPAVVAMLYTSCQGACPLVVSDMQKIEKGLAPALLQKTHFLLVSFDPKDDTPAKLAQYASDHALDLKRWTLMTGSVEAVRDLAAALDVRYRRLQNGEYSHSTVISVLDPEGVIRFQQRGVKSSPQEAIAALKSSS